MDPRTTQLIEGVHMTGDDSAARPRRWIRSTVVLLAAAAGLVATSAPASATAPPSDDYTVCRPTPCIPIAEAVVTGTVAWTTNVNTFEAKNARLPVVTVFFTELDNGVPVSTRPFRVLRGAVVTGKTSVRPTTDVLRVSLCPSASEAPQANCAIAVVERAR